MLLVRTSTGQVKLIFHLSFSRCVITVSIISKYHIVSHMCTVIIQQRNNVTIWTTVCVWTTSRNCESKARIVISRNLWLPRVNKPLPWLHVYSYTGTLWVNWNSRCHADCSGKSITGSGSAALQQTSLRRVITDFTSHYLFIQCPSSSQFYFVLLYTRQNNI